MYNIKIITVTRRKNIYIYDNINIQMTDIQYNIKYEYDLTIV